MNGVASELVEKPVHIRTVDGAEAIALTSFFNTVVAEFEPDHPPTPLEENLVNWRNIPQDVGVEAWAYWVGERVVASADIGYDLEGMNTHACRFQIDVAPEFRRQGLGTGLLTRILEVAQRKQRRLMFTGTRALIGAGERFAERFGGQRGQDMHVNQLLLNDLDEGLMRRWVSEAPRDRFELGFWDNGYPDDELEQIAALYEVMNTAPRGDLEINDAKITAERLRVSQQENKARGMEVLTAWVREKSSGQYVGFSVLFWNQNQPKKLGQADTGVHPNFRGYGLGKWLKAANLEAMRAKHPGVESVRASNADSNGSMLKINSAMGFAPHLASTTWQFDVAATFERLRQLNKNPS